MSSTSSLLTTGWVATLAVGFGLLAQYETTEGPAGDPPVAWPAAAAAAGLQPDADHPTLLMFVHPKCPCTRASLAELDRFATRRADRLAVQVLLMRPDGTSADFADTDLAQTAARIPGARVATDEAGVLSALFGIKTSGHVLLYDTTGELLFSGGVTGSRGHEGDNPGRASLTALLRDEPAGDRPAPMSTPVFGCELHAAHCDDAMPETAVAR